MATDIKTIVFTSNVAVISGICEVTGQLYSVMFDPAGLQKWKDGVPLYKAFPGLTWSELTFINKGITPQEWKAAYDDCEPEEVPRLHEP